MTKDMLGEEDHPADKVPPYSCLLLGTWGFPPGDLLNLAHCPCSACVWLTAYHSSRLQVVRSLITKLGRTDTSILVKRQGKQHREKTALWTTMLFALCVSIWYTSLDMRHNRSKQGTVEMGKENIKRRVIHRHQEPIMCRELDKCHL